MSSDKINILLVQDNPLDAASLRESLEKSEAGQFSVDHAEHMEKALVRLKGGGTDLVILDLSLSDAKGTEALDTIRRHYPYIPIVVLTGPQEEKLAIKALEAGAQDYLNKGELSLEIMERSIRYAIERVKSIENLQASEMESRLIMEAVTDAFVRIDKEGKIRDMNRRAEHIFGWPLYKIKDKPFVDTFFPADQSAILKEEIHRYFNEGTLPSYDRRVELNALTRTGTNILLEMTYWPIKSQGEIFLNFLLADISEQKKLETMKNNFIYMASHELKTPMAIIKEGISLIREGLVKTPEEREKIYEMTIGNIERLTRVVNNVLDITKIESGLEEIIKVECSLSSIIKNAAANFDERVKESGLALKIKLPDKDIKTFVDPDEITHVFMNLIENALKFTKKGSITISAEEQDDMIKCCVTDTGRGIPQEDIECVFSKFYQISRVDTVGEKGSGLGLPICKGIVELHGGRIWIESKVGEGSKFFFTLPGSKPGQCYREKVDFEIEHATREQSFVSIIGIDFSAKKKQEAKKNNKHIEQCLSDIEKTIRQSLRRKDDFVFIEDRNFYVVLPMTSKKDAGAVAEKIKAEIENLFIKLTPKGSLDVTCRLAGFPDDGKSAAHLIEMVGPE